MPSGPTLPPAVGLSWVVSPNDKLIYDQHFEIADQDLDGFVNGLEVKDIFLQSGLPQNMLAHIWSLADMEGAGKLNREQFAVAMWLIKQSLAGIEPPQVLAQEMIPPSMRKVALMDGVNEETNKENNGIDVAPKLPAGPSVPPPGVGWVVSANDKLMFDQTFKKADLDMDGFVNGQEARDIFIQSGLPQNILAHIWSLADLDGSGKLNHEQFAIAMWLIKQALAGVEPPQMLTPEMIPPSMRRPVLFEGFEDANKSIDAIVEEVDLVIKEKNQLERDCAQQDADVKIKSGELVCLRADLDATLNTVQQLEKQKGEAQKRLDDLDSQIARLNEELEETVQKLANQHQRKSEEDKLNVSRMELNEVREEEKRLSVKLATWKDRADSIQGQKDKVATETENLRNRQESLMAKNRDLSHSVIHLTNIVEGEVGIPDQIPTLVAVSSADRERLPTQPVVGTNSFLAGHAPSAPVSSTTATTTTTADPFNTGEDPFKEDPFAGFGVSGGPITGSGDAGDPFDADPFGSGFGDLATKKAPKVNGGPGQFIDFDPFSSMGGKSDAAAVDPFSAASSSVPDLPPKMSKAVPPRPLAPPARPSTGPSPRPSPVPPAMAMISPGGSTPVRVSPSPASKNESLSPSPLPKLNPVRAAPLRPAKPPAATSSSSLPAPGAISLFPDSGADDPFAMSTEDSFSISGPAAAAGGTDPFSCLHMPPPKSESGSLGGSARGTGANTPASLQGDAFGAAADPFGGPPAATVPESAPGAHVSATKDSFDPFGFNSEVNEATESAANTTAFNEDLFGGLGVFSSSTNENAKSAPPFPVTASAAAANDDPFSPKGNSASTFPSGDAFDAKFDAFEGRSSSATFGNEPFGAASFDAVDSAFGENAGANASASNATSGFAAFDAHFGGDAFGSAQAKPPSSPAATSTSGGATASSSSLFGLLSKPPSSKSHSSPKSDSQHHHRERKKSEGPSKSKNGLGGKKTEKSKG